MAKTYTFPMMVDDFKKLSRYDQMAAVTQAEKRGIPYNKAVVKTMLGALQSYPNSEKVTVTIPDNPRDGEYIGKRNSRVGNPERMDQRGKAGISSKYDPTPGDGRITQEDYDYVKKQRKEGNYNTFGALDPLVYNMAEDVPEAPKQSEKKKAKSDPGEAVSDKPKPEDIDPPEEGAPDKVEPEAKDVQKPAGKKKAEASPSKAEVDRPDPDDVPSARVIPEDAGPAPDISQVSKALEELGRANPTMQKEPTEETEQGFKVERLVDRVKDSIDADLEDSPPADVPDVELEERADPPAASRQMAAKLPDAEADAGEPEMEDFGADVELEESPSVSASDIEEFAEDVPNGMDYLKVAFKDFNRKAYNPDSVVDRRRMQFLMNFLKKAGFPQDPDDRALVARQAFRRLQEQLTESSEAQSSRTRQAIDRE
tara:strand:+ start:298 stop:1575 length:1278 start_codon:yes stop_codon:yes gene_type:complete